MLKEIAKKIAQTVAESAAGGHSPQKWVEHEPTEPSNFTIEFDRTDKRDSYSLILNVGQKVIFFQDEKHAVFIRPLTQDTAEVCVLTHSHQDVKVAGLDGVNTDVFFGDKPVMLESCSNRWDSEGTTSTRRILHKSYIFRDGSSSIAVDEETGVLTFLGGTITRNEGIGRNGNSGNHSR